MRMRKKKHGAERIEACAELRIADPAAMLEGFDKIFGNGRPVHMEIGCGKGNFACGMAKKYPDVNFVAVERVADVCCIALEKAKAAGDTNVYLVDCYGCFGEDVNGECGTVDDCHPDSLGFLRMAERVYPVLNKLLNK